MLVPGSPMLFQGQEFAASAPFYYFADHNPELAKLVASGRKEFLSQFKTIACANAELLANPESVETFERCKLDFSERTRHAPMYALHRDLIRLRREDPVFSAPRRGGLDGAVLGQDVFVLRFFGPAREDRLLLVNLGTDLRLDPVPEPLLAAPEECIWRLRWSSEDTAYGGCGTPPLEEESKWYITGQAAVVLVPQPAPPSDHGEDHSQD
jgi:maltooligosyltrehalose trehalohydrolase